jgi:prephenate dehydrogenase
VREIGIVGLGLIGGSLGMALKGLAAPVRVTGISRTEDDARLAERLGAADRAGTQVESLVDCDLVVVATPISECPMVFEQVGRCLPGDLLITDVASVKAPIVEMASRMPAPARFLAGHPMAGKAETGVRHGDPALFAGSPWVFTPQPGQDLRRFDWWLELVKQIGATPIFLSAEEHDRRAAFVSHLAFTLSSAYVAAVRGNGGEAMAGPGYRSMARLASGDSRMYADIGVANRRQLLEAIDAFTQTLGQYRQAIAEGDRLGALFSQVSRAAD